MAFIDQTRAARVSPRGFATLSAVFASFTAWSDARETRKALNALSSRELEDIGLCRADIDGVAQSQLRK